MIKRNLTTELGVPCHFVDNTHTQSQKIPVFQAGIPQAHKAQMWYITEGFT